ncbi:MAG: metalloregulator ArsR/SmtB family transcription factor [Anaerolineales bacterium]
MNETLIAQAKQQAALCRVFSNPCRLLILWSLVGGELAVNEIATQVGSSLQNVSQHLRLLKGRELIASRREGHHVFYRIKESNWLSTCQAMTNFSNPSSECTQIATFNGGTK